MTLEELVALPEYAGLVEARDYQAIAKALNEMVMVDNPEPQLQVAKPVQFIDELFAIILQDAGTDPDRFAADNAALAALDQHLQRGERLAKYFGLQFSGPIGAVTELASNKFGLTETTRSRIQARLAETIPDPDYREQIPSDSIAKQNGLGIVTARHVQGVVINADT